MTEAPEILEAISLTDLAMEMGMINEEQGAIVEARRKVLNKSGIKLTPGQALIERRLLQPIQIRELTKELERRGLPAQPPNNLTPKSFPRKFGHYELLEVLSEKTHSRIIKAHDNVMGRMVVLKVLPPQIKHNPQWAERFRRETMVLGRMAHPNLVKAFAAEEIEGTSVIAMEYVEGDTIGDRIEKEGFLPEKEAWLIGREIAKALAYAAKLGVIHRDIKPDNILCSRNGKIKLIDMGFSKSSNETKLLTMEGTTVGTPFYISPEQAQSSRELDARTDIYSLGCTIFHMLTGSPPFWGDEITEIMLKHVEGKRPDPRKLLPGLSHSSAELVTRMMAIDPADRPASADKLTEEITAILPVLPRWVGQPVAKPWRKATRSSPQTRRAVQVPKIGAIARIPAQDLSPRNMGKKHNQMPSGTQSRGWARIKSWFGIK